MNIAMAGRVDDLLLLRRSRTKRFPPTDRQVEHSEVRFQNLALHELALDIHIKFIYIYARIIKNTKNKGS